MTEWIFTISIVVFIAGTVLSVLEEWTKQGLTDTSYLCLALWAIGSIGLIAGSYFLHFMTLGACAAIALILSAYAIALKLHDHRQYWKNFTHAIRRRR